MDQEVEDGVEIDQIESDLREGLDNAKRLVEKAKSLLDGSAHSTGASRTSCVIDPTVPLGY